MSKETRRRQKNTLTYLMANNQKAQATFSDFFEEYKHIVSLDGPGTYFKFESFIEGQTDVEYSQMQVVSEKQEGGDNVTMK